MELKVQQEAGRLYKSITEFEEEVVRRIGTHDLDAALNLIMNFVTNILKDELSIANVFGSEILDNLCVKIGSDAEIADERIGADEEANKKLMVFIATELYNSGGHTKVIEEIIAAQPERSHAILLTNVLGTADYKSIVKRFSYLNVPVECAPDVSALDKLRWLQERLRTLNPGRTLLFNHHQDAVAVAAIQSIVKRVNSEIIFYHHVDHQFCLGNYLTCAVHVDPHNLGFFNCRNQLGLEKNIFWPLAVRDRGVRSNKQPFMADGRLRTCTSGHRFKFERPYRYSYAEEVPNLLQITGGVHIHIGDLSPGMVEAIFTSLNSRGIEKQRFVWIPWVRSLWQALIEQRVDIYISSFPLGGGMASVEVMGSGTPIVVHQSYLSRFHGGADLVYPEAFAWKTVSELYEYIQGLTPEELKQHSALARRHYELYYSIDKLQEKLQADRIATSEGIAPLPLRKYTPDLLQRWLDQNRYVIEKVDSVRENITQLEDEIGRLKLQLAERETAMKSILDSTSWRMTALFRSSGNFVRSLPRCGNLVGKLISKQRSGKMFKRVLYPLGRRLFQRD